MAKGKPTPDSPASETRSMREGNEALAPDQASLDQFQDDPAHGHGGVHAPMRADAKSLPGTPGRAAGSPGDPEPERGIEADAPDSEARRQGGLTREDPRDADEDERLLDEVREVPRR